MLEVITDLISHVFLLDELVMLGNHRDAWVFGAADASSGSAAMMELSRVLGEQLKKGIGCM